jgi:hypothetical protein
MKVLMADALCLFQLRVPLQLHVPKQSTAVALEPRVRIERKRWRSRNANAQRRWNSACAEERVPCYRNRKTSGALHEPRCAANSAHDARLIPTDDTQGPETRRKPHGILPNGGERTRLELPGHARKYYQCAHQCGAVA